MSSTPQAREEILASLISISKRMQVCTKSSFDKLRATAKPDPSAPLECIHLPKPPPLLSRLLEAGAPQHLAQEMHTIYLDHATRLRKHYTTVISRLRKDLPPPPTDSVDTFHDRLVPLLLSMYTKALQDWVREAVDMFHTRRPAAHKKSFNQTFNHDYLPLLEHFFDDNPFPTHADKAALARKSGMSYQQIHVWFQNRRTRSRRVGKVLRKKPLSEGTALRDSVDSCVDKFDETIVEKSCRDESKKFDSPGQSFDYCSVSKLRHSAHIELEFDPSWWRRHPSSAKPRRSSFDMDVLVEKLSQLSVRDRTSGRGKKHQDTLRYPLAAISSITVMPLPAPHPALIRRRDVSLPPLPPLVVPHTSASRHTRLQAFNTPSSTSSSNLLASSVVSNSPESPRKRRKVISKDTSHRESSSVHGTRSMFNCGSASLRSPQQTPFSIPCLSASTTPDLVTPNNGSHWVCPGAALGDHPLATVQALSRHAIPPWDFRFAVTV